MQFKLRSTSYTELIPDALIAEKMLCHLWW